MLPLEAHTLGRRLPPRHVGKRIGAGSLTAVAGSPFASGSGASSQPTGASVNPAGNYLYISNAADFTVSAFQIARSGAAPGALTSLGAAVATGVRPAYLLAHAAPPSVTIAGLSPTSGAVGKIVTITSTNFGATQWR